MGQCCSKFQKQNIIMRTIWGVNKSISFFYFCRILLNFFKILIYAEIYLSCYFFQENFLYVYICCTFTELHILGKHSSENLPNSQFCSWFHPNRQWQSLGWSSTWRGFVTLLSTFPATRHKMTTATSSSIPECLL